MSEILGNNLKILRDYLNLSQANLAENLSLTTSAIGLVEKNRSNLKIDNLVKISELYNVNINWLLTGKGEIFIEDKNTFELKSTNKLSKFKNFASRFNKLIKKSNLDVKTFSGVIDVKLERVADLSVGVKSPTLDEIITICECFNITSDWLLFGIE